MNVVDAGVVVELVASDLDPARLGAQDLAAPHLIDSEALHALRGLVLRGELSATQAEVALDGFAALTIQRFGVEAMRPRIWQLRHNLSAYDATYVALAETLGATLLTTDQWLAGAPGVACPVELL